MLQRRKSYVELSIPNKQQFVETQKEIKNNYYGKFCEWFNLKYLFKINEKVAENIQRDCYATYFKLHIPKSFLNSYKIYNKHLYIKHRYHLPQITYDKIKNTWEEKGWKINISDNVIYTKDSKVKPYSISDGKHKLSRDHIIFCITVSNKMSSSSLSSSNSNSNSNSTSEHL